MTQAASADLDFDPEDADECDDLDDFMSQAASARCSAALESKAHKAQLHWDLVSAVSAGCIAC